MEANRSQNVASEFRPDKELHSKSGTLAYLAPEAYEGKGYLSEVDWWSLGVTFYECIYNKRPFEGNNHEKLEREIVKANPNYPVTQPPVSMPCLHAISSLLEKDRTNRIGAAGFETFTDNPFFRCIDFVALELKQVPPVFIPSSEKTNFDATYDLEELLLEEAPLEARARRQKPRVQLKDDATDKEIREDELHRMIETLFEPFDYTTVAFPNPLCSSAGGPPQPPAQSQSSTELGHTRMNRSGTASPASPPLLAPAEHSGHLDYFPAPSHPLAPTSAPRPVGGTRSTSRGGGLQVVLGETGSWSDLTNPSAAMPPENAGLDSMGTGRGKPTGMLGFLSRKRGRERSPKPVEQGVLGKEGARVVINGGGR
ncbi:MAG: hypothetical protein LQ347_003257 [Umbilicaria vellea]|nr:MAG: hypothetical protein LQ347_003257 [Umbilicaria vellea]